ncbi:MAG: HAMP domain-containing histidine kinase [Candidatus Brocadiia bacterium]|nr:MAG: HAMP domain-containing histidine kinase [Candidatus Brocadiia bacterium]
MCIRGSPNIMLLRKWKPTPNQRIKMAEPTYGFFFEDSDHKYVLSGAPDILFSFTHPFEKTFLCRIIDNLGNTYKLVDFPSEYHFIGLEQASQILKNENADTKPMLTVSMGKYFPGWVFELYPKNGEIFENAASKQTAIYTWTGVLVVLLILSSGAVSGQVISRQIKLNRLKNDFIATITHELKTPLSSMRVLVDTLLEDRCQSKQQETEYLELISKENIRLSRLIDNFLTFSRMERNKQAFDMAKTNPAEIAKAAAEAVQTKFNHENRKLTVTIGDNLPSISADKDTMVAVLMNLLDNAYKYSYDNKQIELRVFSEESYVCFAVKDNGIGMTKRQIKRIFDRFYQVDTSLTRRAEGSGLGLSIVKFIVDAHKGRIDVESTVGKGSEFIVKIPIYGNSFNNRR